MLTIGLDLSLTSTGWARLHTNNNHQIIEQTTGRITPTTTGPQRLIEIRNTIAGLITTPDLVAIESYAYGRPQGMAALGELGGVIRTWLHEHGIPYLDIPPATLKTYATGKGNAAKIDVLLAARDRAGYTSNSNDEADAIWLAHLAHHHTTGTPTIPLPKTHTRALTKLGAAA